MNIDQDFSGEPLEPEQTASDEQRVEAPVSESEERRSRPKKPPSSAFIEFGAQFEQAQTIEEKIRISLDFMRAALAQTGAPRFEDFWSGRKLCLPLFKETINPKSRAQFWGEYIELSSEARRLKEILDEQSAFAVEQIELAILAIENDIQQYDIHLAQVPEIHFPESSPTLSTKKELYNSLQRELHLLNTLASRVNSLRKEILKTGMRIRFKNKFFERLSACGDKIFPRRKELIKTISQEFMGDVEAFINDHFKEEEMSQEPLFILREEIKALQSIAKILTLNTHSFTETRLRLSECWDQIKQREKERKKEFAQKKQAYKQNYDAVFEKIQELAAFCTGENSSIEEANQKSDEILSVMRDTELGRDEVRALKDEIHRARRPLLDKAREQEHERERNEREIERQKKEKIEELKQRLQQLAQQAEQIDMEKLVESRDQLLAEFEKTAFSKLERQISDRTFKQLKDIIGDKKQKALLSLSADDRETLDQLKAALGHRKVERQDIKNQLENYRKALGGSGFDFEKAMLYRELIEADKLRLEKVSDAIDEIEDKVSEIEG